MAGQGELGVAGEVEWDVAGEVEEGGMVGSKEGLPGWLPSLTCSHRSSPGCMSAKDNIIFVFV